MNIWCRVERRGFDGFPKKIFLKEKSNFDLLNNWCLACSEGWQSQPQPHPRAWPTTDWSMAWQRRRLRRKMRGCEKSIMTSRPFAWLNQTPTAGPLLPVVRVHLADVPMKNNALSPCENFFVIDCNRPVNPSVMLLHLFFLGNFQRYKAD